MRHKETCTLNTVIDDRTAMETAVGERWWKTCVYFNGLKSGLVGVYPYEQIARQSHKRWAEPFQTASRHRSFHLLVAEDNPRDTKHVLIAFKPSDLWEVAKVEHGQAVLNLLWGGSISKRLEGSP